MGALLRSVAIAALLASASPGFAQVHVSITVAPPPLPVYEQPLCPGDGYIWTPGYWAWDDDSGGYYWVPGTWIQPPSVGLLWTPGYWNWQGGTFVFVGGYWGPVVGFYGGIDYGFGYPGHGYYGGRWTNGRFFYNRSVSHVDVTVVRNTYVQNVERQRSANRVSYHGRDGIAAPPTAREAAAAKDTHLPPTAAQTEHVQLARRLPQLHAAENEGKPPIPATARPEALQRRTPSGRGAESPPDRSPNAAPKEHSEPLPARPPTRSDRPSADEAGRSEENHGFNEAARPNAGADRAQQPPPAARRTPPTGNRARDERSAKTQQDKKARQEKKRDQEQGDH